MVNTLACRGIKIGKKYEIYEHFTKWTVPTQNP